ncbi:MAG: DUF3592 domain-containing protein [Candidatus Altiarchaeota archaeon]
MNPKVLRLIAKARASGLDDQEIAIRLAGIGITEEDMRAGFAQAPAAPPRDPPQQPQPNLTLPPSTTNQPPQPPQPPQTFDTQGRATDAQRRQVSPTTAKIMFLIFLLVGLGVSYLGYTIYETGEASKNWPTVSGTVLISNVATAHDSDGDITYKAALDYNYSVSGRVYHSNKISSGDYGSSDSSHAQDIVSDYPIRKKVTVYYDPAKPSNAILEPGVPLLSFLLVTLFGVLFAVIGFAGVTGIIKPTMYYSNTPTHHHHHDSHMSVTLWKRH